MTCQGFIDELTVIQWKDMYEDAMKSEAKDRSRSPEEKDKWEQTTEERNVKEQKSEKCNEETKRNEEV